jgi:ankyrin repeat protein
MLNAFHYVTLSSDARFLLQACRYLLKAAISGDVNTAKVLVKCTSDNYTEDDGSGFTPLMYAAGGGRVEVMRVLLEGGTITERVDDDGITAVHHAALYGRRDVCRLLLDWGANVNALSNGV